MTQLPEMVRCVVMRGGTSKALFFKENDLPKEKSSREKLLLSIFGSPDARQIDGLGGADPLTSKCAIIGPGSIPGADVDYTFVQITPSSNILGYSVNCGNISSAVGPYAIEEGFVRATDPVTTVKVHNTNTHAVIEELVPTQNGRPRVSGDYAIDGVPGTSAKIDMLFRNVTGGVTGKLLPTGLVSQPITMSDGRCAEVSIVDAGNLYVFAEASALGICGTVSALELEQKCKILADLEDIRCAVAVELGFATERLEASRISPVVPKIAIISNPEDFVTDDGRRIVSSSFNIAARMISSGRVHKAYAVTGAICLAVAAELEGTVVHKVLRKAEPGQEFRIGHPSGILGLRVRRSEGEQIEWVSLSRTARRLMEGYAYARI